jgi:hypothetical protein
MLKCLKCYNCMHETGTQPNPGRSARTRYHGWIAHLNLKEYWFNNIYVQASASPLIDVYHNSHSCLSQSDIKKDLENCQNNLMLEV